MSLRRFLTVLAASVIVLAPMPAAHGILGSLAPSAASAAQPRDNWEVDVKIDVDWEQVAKAAWKGVKRLWSKIATQHPIRQQILTVDGHRIVIIPIKNGGTKRITDNTHLNAAWKTPAKVRVFFANTGKVNPGTLRAQQKHDARWSGDENVSETFGHGDLVELQGGKSDYFAGRSPGFRKSMCLVIVPADMKPSQLNRVSGVVVR